MSQTILVVEDSPVFQKLLVRLLTKQDYTVVAAYSGEIALEKVQEALPDFDFCSTFCYLGLMAMLSVGN